MARWAAPPMDRRQAIMFTPTLDQVIPEDHPVRLFDEILTQCDWTGWEAQYVQVIGQPPIHPRIMAAAILYGLSHGIRSSRRLEWACKNAMDFIWLTEGRDIDHSTFCNFRTRFGRELKDLFVQIGQIAMTMGMIRLNQVALDGTRVKANSSRHSTASAKTLEGRLAELDKQVEMMFSQADQADRREDDLFGNSVSPNHLPKELSDLRRRQERLGKALASARSKEAKRKDGKDESKPAKVPVADPDSSIQPNKEGGYAPNYTPMAATDGTKGFIVDADVLSDGGEGQATVATVDRIEDQFGAKPDQFLADSAHASGTNLEELDRREVEAYIPVTQREDTKDNPARRADPTEPVPQVDWLRLPRNGRTRKLDRCAFIYDSAKDCYYCPMGHALEFLRVQDKCRSNGGGVYHLYRCKSCMGCPLAGECVSSKTGFRTVFRDEQEHFREAMDARLGTEEGKKTYSRRKWIAETPFAVLKACMGLRQFLLRGLEKVRTEWLWSCTAFNLSKLVREVIRMRVEFAAILA